jgi:hypothetical protein
MVKRPRERTQRAHEISGRRNRAHTKPIWSQDGQRGHREPMRSADGETGHTQTEPIWSQEGERGYKEPIRSADGDIGHTQSPYGQRTEREDTESP